MARGTVIPLAFGVALLIAACSGGDSEETTPTATQGARVIATATPFATLPTTTIIDGDASTGPTAAADVTYTVVAGDSLSLIAERFETTAEEIQSLNELPNVNIFVDQELLIPGANGSIAKPKPTPSTPGATQQYVIQSGDSGFGIALEFGLTLEELAAANGLSVDQLNELFVGQELLIPSP
jgi:LysM repeat protein